MTYTIKPLNWGELRACNGMGAVATTGVFWIDVKPMNQTKQYKWKIQKGATSIAFGVSQTLEQGKIGNVGIVPAFVCNFRDYSETYIIGAYIVQQELTVRKSLSLETCRELGTLISQRKLRIHWRYDLSVL